MYCQLSLVYKDLNELQVDTQCCEGETQGSFSLGKYRNLKSPLSTQRVHVGIWYILRAQRGSHIPTLRPKYIPYSYIGPFGVDRIWDKKGTLLWY